MSLVTRFVTALVHEMDGAELDMWVSALRGRSGQELQRLLQLAPPSAGAERIGDWVEDHHDEAADLLPSLLGLGAGSAAAEGTMIPDYLAVLNGIASVAICCRRPLVLRGFFHCTDCLSHWYFDRERLESLHSFTRDASEDLIKCGGSRPGIFMLGGPSGNDRVRALNLEIRRSPLQCLDRCLYAGGPEVHIVREFRVEFTPGDPDAEIPLGAHGIIQMMASLPVALDAQRMPKEEVHKAVLAAGAGIRRG